MVVLHSDSTRTDRNSVEVAAVVGLVLAVDIAAGIVADSHLGLEELV